MAAVPCCVGFLVGFGSVTPPPSRPSPHPRWVSRPGMEGGVCVWVACLLPRSASMDPPCSNWLDPPKPHLILLTVLGFPGEGWGEGVCQVLQGLEVARAPKAVQVLAQAASGGTSRSSSRHL